LTLPLLIQSFTYISCKYIRPENPGSRPYPPWRFVQLLLYFLYLLHLLQLLKAFDAKTNALPRTKTRKGSNKKGGSYYRSVIDILID